jgi:hypothetical protein
MDKLPKLTQEEKENKQTHNKQIDGVNNEKKKRKSGRLG